MDEFFGNERRSNLQLSECVKLEIEMNKTYIVSLQIFCISEKHLYQNTKIFYVMVSFFVILNIMELLV